MNLTISALQGLSLAQADATQAVPVPVDTTTVTPTETTIETTVQSGAPIPASKPATQPTPWWASQWIPLLLILLMAWLLIFRPKNKTEKSRVQMLNSLKKGDRIQTIGGIIGTVVEVRDDEVVVKVDEASNTKLTFSRNAIHRVKEQDKK